MYSYIFLFQETNLCYSLSLDTNKNVAESTKTLELAKMPNYTMVDDLLCPPGRQNRPPKIAIILRGPPGSGKSFVAKLIKVYYTKCLKLLHVLTNISKLLICMKYKY